MNQMTTPVTLTPPNQRVRLGIKKWDQLKRSQDFLESFAWGTVVLVVSMFFLDGGLAG